jgi:hypothetical protein
MSTAKKKTRPNYAKQDHTGTPRSLIEQLRLKRIGDGPMKYFILVAEGARGLILSRFRGYADPTACTDEDERDMLVARIAHEMGITHQITGHVAVMAFESEDECKHAYDFHVRASGAVSDRRPSN